VHPGQKDVIFVAGADMVADFLFVHPEGNAVMVMGKKLSQRRAPASGADYSDIKGSMLCCATHLIFLLRRFLAPRKAA
jgi:hypothetical protein